MDSAAGSGHRPAAVVGLPSTRGRTEPSGWRAAGPGQQPSPVPRISTAAVQRTADVHLSPPRSPCFAVYKNSYLRDHTALPTWPPTHRDAAPLPTPVAERQAPLLVTQLQGHIQHCIRLVRLRLKVRSHLRVPLFRLDCTPEGNPLRAFIGSIVCRPPIVDTLGAAPCVESCRQRSGGTTEKKINVA